MRPYGMRVEHFGKPGSPTDFFAAIEREEWMSRGRCADPAENSEDWFPDNGGATTSTPEVRHALALCRACPVHYHCLHYAMTHTGLPRRLSGIWGGTTEGMRRRALHDEGAA